MSKICHDRQHQIRFAFNGALYADLIKRDIQNLMNK